MWMVELEVRINTPAGVLTLLVTALCGHSRRSLADVLTLRQSHSRDCALKTWGGFSNPADCVTTASAQLRRGQAFLSCRLQLVWELGKHSCPADGGILEPRTLVTVDRVRGWLSSLWGWWRGNSTITQQSSLAVLTCATLQLALRTGADILSLKTVVWWNFALMTQWSIVKPVDSCIVAADTTDLSGHFYFADRGAVPSWVDVLTLGSLAYLAVITLWIAALRQLQKEYLGGLSNPAFWAQLHLHTKDLGLRFYLRDCGTAGSWIDVPKHP